MAKHSEVITPLVSVCIAVYNCGKYIKETLNCLCAQTYNNIEIIVVNDGSTDDTEKHANDIADKRVKVITVKNGGAAKARNIAYNKAKGAYIIFFDADDYIKPEFITSQVKKIHGRNDVVVLALWGRFYNDEINTFKLNDTPVDAMTFTEWIKFYWYNCSPMTNPGRIIIPAELIKKAGLWNESLNLNDDMEFYTRIFVHAEKIIFNHDAIFYYRSGITGLSGKKDDGAYQALYNSMRLSIDTVLTNYHPEPFLLRSCANMWQSFIFEVYPFQKKYLELAQTEINKLTKPDYKFIAHGYTKYLVSIIGWRLTKRIKLVINKYFN
jgi:glycosyltransferase involved in cell wall biosynthesis